MPEKRDQADESNHADDVWPKSVISYKEYKAQKEQGASGADKYTPEEEEYCHLRTLPQGPAPWHPPKKMSGSR